MNRFAAAWIVVFASVALILHHPAGAHAAAKKKKKPTTEASDSDSTGATPAPKRSNSSEAPLDLPLPKKKESEEKKDATPASKKSTDGEEKSKASSKAEKQSEKAADKPSDKADKSTEKSESDAKPKLEHAPSATVEPEKIGDFAAQPPRIQQLIRDAVDLTRQNLTYTFGSSDPNNGGMDCSGTIYYLLRAHDFTDVPRDSSGQYMWARRSGAFFPVVSKSADSPEFKELLPGDLMFWTGTYESGRDIPITHVMLYLGREKGSGRRIMFGASDGRSYNGVQRWGVSVFDFKMPNASTTDPTKAKVDFVGYARIPGLRGSVPIPQAEEKTELETTAETPKKEAAAATPTPKPKSKTTTKSTQKKKKANPD